jgi:cell division protein FtsB
MLRKTKRKIIIGLILGSVPLVLLAQEGLSKYERIVSLEERVNKLEQEVADLKSKLVDGL